MKINSSIYLKAFLLVLSVSIISSTTISKFLEVEGSSNNYGGKAVEAVNSGLAKTKNQDIILTNDPRYRTPLIAQKLELREPIKPSQAESAEEIPTGVEVYYDGQLGIKHFASFCQQFIDKQSACMNQGSCGWCMGEGTCVAGNAKGPVNNKDCLRGKYVFEEPNKDWNPVTIPNTRLTRSNVLGAQLTTITQQPSK